MQSLRPATTVEDALGWVLSISERWVTVELLWLVATSATLWPGLLLQDCVDGAWVTILSHYVGGVTGGAVRVTPYPGCRCQEKTSGLTAG